MTAAGRSAANELAALRRQLEALTHQVIVLEGRLAAAGPTANARSPAADAAIREKIPWLVIAAAVATVVRGPHRIVSLQMPGLPPLNLWSIEGRRAVFHSHRIR